MLEPRSTLWLCTVPTDMRKSFRGLVTCVKRSLDEDPLSGHYFIFVNRRKTLMKVLYYEPGGYCIWSKRLDAGQFNHRTSAQPKLSLTRSELQGMIDGVAYQAIKRFKRHRR